MSESRYTQPTLEKEEHASSLGLHNRLSCRLLVELWMLYESLLDNIGGKSKTLSKI